MTCPKFHGDYRKAVTAHTKSAKAGPSLISKSEQAGQSSGANSQVDDEYVAGRKTSAMADTQSKPLRNPCFAACYGVVTFHWPNFMTLHHTPSCSTAATSPSSFNPTRRHPARDAR